MNIYSEPGNFGLETIGEIEWTDMSYQFDLTVVWRRTADGVFLYGEDSGCSCPAPFEDMGMSDLTPIGTLSDFKVHLEARARGVSYPPTSLDCDVAEILERLHTAGAR